MTRMRLSLVLVLASVSSSCDSSPKKTLSGSTCIVEQSDLREKLTPKERDVFKACYSEGTPDQEVVRDRICKRAGCRGDGLHTISPNSKQGKATQRWATTKHLAWLSDAAIGYVLSELENESRSSRLWRCKKGVLELAKPKLGEKDGGNPCVLPRLREMSEWTEKAKKTLRPKGKYVCKNSKHTKLVEKLAFLGTTPDSEANSKMKFTFPQEITKKHTLALIDGELAARLRSLGFGQANTVVQGFEFDYKPVQYCFGGIPLLANSQDFCWSAIKLCGSQVMCWQLVHNCRMVIARRALNLKQGN